MSPQYIYKRELDNIADSVFLNALEGVPEDSVEKCLAFISFVRTYDFGRLCIIICLPICNLNLGIPQLYGMHGHL